MKTVIAIAFTLTSLFAFSQTDIIEMRSRNASLKKYRKMTIPADADHIPSNFGMLAMEEVKNAILDSVTIVSDSVAIMYTSEYCTGLTRVYEPYREHETPNRLHPRIGDLWQPGVDTVVNHPLFRHRHSLDSIKEALDRDYYFNLPADSIKFIGFDNSNAHTNTDSIQPVKHKRPKENSIGWELLFMLLTPILFMYAMSRFVLPRTSNSN